MAEVIDRYARLLWKVASAVLSGSEQDTEECVADVFIYLWQHPERFDPARGSLKTWLSVVARSRAADRRRALDRHAALPLDAPEAAASLLFSGLSPEAASCLAEDREALSEALDRLEPTEREVLLRRCLEGQKPRQIALALGMPPKKVENILYRTKQKLRRMLRPELASPSKENHYDIKKSIPYQGRF